MAAIWFAPFGWGIFFTALVIAIILYLFKQKFYPVSYLVSIATYVFTIGFLIDAFTLGKASILSLLTLSALLFMLAGYHLSKKFNIHKERIIASIPEKRR